MGFRGVDYYDIASLLSEEERLIQKTVRAFVDERVIPVIAKHYDAGTFPKELVQVMGKMGLLGATLEGYGCAGLGAVAYGLILQELERGDSGIRSFASVQGSLVMYPIHAFGSEEQKERWLPRLASGDAIGCFGLTEPDFGSNPGGMLTRAEKVSGGYVLNGTKRWITNAGISDVAVVWGKLDGEIRGFLVPGDAPGLTQRKIHDKFSLRASVTGELLLEDCRIDDGGLLPKTGALKSPLQCLNQARYGIAWGAVGAAMACYETALDYAKDRVQFSRPIAGYQLVQHKIVEMLTEITKAQLLALRLGRLKEEGKVRHTQVSLAKRNNVSQALQIARMAREILGANGIMYEYPVARHMLNLESVYTYEGTHDIHTLILGEDVTGLSAFE